MRISDFILQNMPTIMAEWESFARTIEPPAFTMDSTALRNHAAQMLEAVAADLGNAQSELEQAEKSKGRGPNTGQETAAESHASARLLSGYSIEQMISEYRALRASVLKLWAAHSHEHLITDANDVTRFNEAIDQLLAESVARFAKTVDRSHHMFLAILGHDLRNPLSTTITASQYIMRGKDIEAKYITVATRINNSSLRMSKLVEDLINFTRTRLGSTLPLERRSVDLAVVALEIIDELRITHPDRQIDFEAEDSYHSQCDKHRVAQVLSNLIGNALQHGSKFDAVKVRIFSSDDDSVITVWNAGRSIPADKLHSIFDPLLRFSEEEGDSYAAGKSLGIGLYIAREMVLAHGGSIDVASTDDSGTTFTVCIPNTLL